MSIPDTPPEVRAAAAYLIGDWTEEPALPDVIPVSRGTSWLFGDDEIMYAAAPTDEDGTYVITWDDEDGYLVTAYINKVADNTYAVRMREGGAMVETTRFRIDFHDSGYVMVDIPRETGGQP